MGVLQYADGSHFVWLWLDCDTGFGSVVIWLTGCLVSLVLASQILGLLGLYKVRSGRGIAGFSLVRLDWCG